MQPCEQRRDTEVQNLPKAQGPKNQPHLPASYHANFPIEISQSSSRPSPYSWILVDESAVADILAIARLFGRTNVNWQESCLSSSRRFNLFPQGWRGLAEVYRLVSFIIIPQVAKSSY